MTSPRQRALPRVGGVRWPVYTPRAGSGCAVKRPYTSRGTSRQTAAGKGKRSLRFNLMWALGYEFKMSPSGYGIMNQITRNKCILGDPGADNGADGKLGGREKRRRRGEGKKAREEKSCFTSAPLSPRPLPLRRRFSSRPSFPSALRLPLGRVACMRKHCRERNHPACVWVA